MTSLWKPTWSQWLHDILFRLGLYRGIRVESPPGLIICSVYHDRLAKRGLGTMTYETCLNKDHPLADFLLHECGPWSFRMERPLYFRRCYLAFARASDAVTFRLLQ